MSVPDGLTINYNMIPVDLAQTVISFLDSKNWSTDLSRRTQHYGYNYNYNGGSLSITQPLEGPILHIAEWLRKSGIIDANQCIVNEYLRNQGISSHIDSKNFGSVIVGISLKDECVMDFINVIDNSVYSILLPIN